MSEVIGVVQTKDISAVVTKFGPKDKIGLRVNNDWYNAFSSEVLLKQVQPVNEGDVVKILYTENGKYKNLTAVEKVAESKPEAKQAVVVSYNRETNINYQSARKDAVEFVRLLVDKEILVLPAKKNKQADALEEAVHEYSLRFAKRALTADLSEVEVETIKNNNATEVREPSE